MRVSFAHFPAKNKKSPRTHRPVSTRDLQAWPQYTPSFLLCQYLSEYFAIFFRSSFFVKQITGGTLFRYYQPFYAYFTSFYIIRKYAYPVFERFSFLVYALFRRFALAFSVIVSYNMLRQLKNCNAQQEANIIEQTGQQLLWRTKYAAGIQTDGKMMIRYRFPFSENREASLLYHYGLSPGGRAAYYGALAQAVERNISISNYLTVQGVSSILSFSDTKQQKEPNGIICIYGTCAQPIQPASQTLLQGETNAMDVLDLFLRLATIIRDIHKAPFQINHRCLDVDDIFITEDKRILLGGFYYSTSPTLPAPQPFLPDHPAFSDLYQSQSEWSDLQQLCHIALNVFSGLCWDAQYPQHSPQIKPFYAPAPLLQLLISTVHARDGQPQAFRKALLQCRKDLSKTPFAQLTMALPTPLKANFRYNTQTSTTEKQKSTQAL